MLAILKRKLLGFSLGQMPAFSGPIGAVPSVAPTTLVAVPVAGSAAVHAAPPALAPVAATPVAPTPTPSVLAIGVPIEQAFGPPVTSVRLPPAIPPTLPPPLPPAFQPSFERALQVARDLTARFAGQPPSLAHEPPFAGQPPTLAHEPPFAGQPPTLAPLLDMTIPCQTCGPVEREQLRRLSGQRGEVQRELQVEKEQLQQQQLQQQQERIQRLRTLEQQPPGARDIVRELSEKQALLAQIESEIQVLQGRQLQAGVVQPQGGIGPLTSGGGAVTVGGPFPASIPAPLIPTDGIQARAAAQHFKQLAAEQLAVEQELPGAEPQLSFCIGCASVEDGVKFLNGEPSQCSVIAGTTTQGPPAPLAIPPADQQQTWAKRVLGLLKHTLGLEALISLVEEVMSSG